ncbi:MAG TPA: Fe-S cluster assembly protein SufD [Verrucomicrobiae bacterium]|jgi:Fe-S cluster assembly protein SufD|nr:Fe-S cluster assembly protein SufD [Verrucomicrobiae bacterium]
MAQTMENEVNGAAPYLKNFERFEQQTNQPAWLFPLRKAGISSFAEQGFPTLKDEDWRFTNVAPIARLPFKPVLQQARDQAAADLLPGAVFANLAGSRLVFVNGHYAADLSSVGALPAGVKVSNLAAALAHDSALVEKHLGRYAQAQGNAFAALNQAFFSDGVFIHVPAGMTVEEPIQLIFISSAKQAGETIQPRNLIIADANSKLTVVESYLSVGNAPYFTNAVTELVAGDNARLEHVKFQDEAADAYHVATIQGEFGRTSHVTVHSFAVGAKLSRNNIRAKLVGEGLECILNGLYLTKDEQLADHHMIVEHAQPHCASHEYFNGILDDKSKGVFHGRILVRQIAQKTDAKQTNKNLLLSDDATADTKPQLEIYADDVKCTHGATIGQLNDESIFYLRSRGIDTETARRMLIHAFAGEIIERIQCEGAREELNKLVWDRIEANPHVVEKK